jgi:hypothetical protein
MHHFARSTTPLLSALSALLLAAAACTANTTPHPVATEPRDLGPDSFLGDVVGDATEDGTGDAAADESADVPDDTNPVGRPCLLLAPDCGDGFKCAPDADRGASCQPLPHDPVGDGLPCGQGGLDDCDAGLLCYAASEDTADLRCTSLCDPQSASGCSGGATCSGPLTWVDEAVGVCEGTGAAP